MDRFIARANIDHFLGLLDNDVNDGSMIHRLLIEEVNRLGRDIEQLEFAESRVAKFRIRFDRLCQWRDGFAEGSASRAQAERVVAKFQETLDYVEGLCRQMREHVNGVPG